MRRSRALVVVLVVAGALLVGFLARLQLVGSERYVERGRNQRLVSTDLLATRGAIVDRQGEPLALSLPAKAVVVDPRQVRDPDATARALAAALGQQQADVREVITRPGTGFAYVARQLEPVAAARVEELGLPGISTVEESRRVTAADDLALSVVGRMDAFAESPSFGLEEQYDERLRGRDGEREAERGGDGGTIAGTERYPEVARQGDQLALTLDRSMQYWAEEAIEEQVLLTGAAGGTVVLGRPATGEVLAMASAVRDGTEARPSQLNLAVRTYEPGSVLKVVTAAAAFEEGVVEPDTVLTVPPRIEVADRTISDASPHPTQDMTFQEIISESSNVGTIKVAQRLGQERILDYLDRFRLGELTNLGLDKEQAGGFRREWYGSDIGSIPIGQSITATPLQVWSVFNVIANGGTYVPPRLIDHWTSPTGEVTEPELPPRSRVVSPDAAGKVRAALQQVTEDGTGRKYAIEGYHVAAKTGTAYQPLGPGLGYGSGGNRHYAASFAGFLPASDPEISIMVMLDDPVQGSHSGSTAAGPVFDRLAREAIRRYALSPDGAEPVAGVPARPVRARAAVAPAPPPLPVPEAVPSTPAPSEPPPADGG